MTNDSNNSEDTGLFTMIPDELLSNYDYKHMILLSRIARLAFTSGYCNASNEYLFEHIHKLTKNKLNSSLDWLEDQGLIVRYNQLNMINGDFLRTKRLIVLSKYSYHVYQSVNARAGNKMHEPIECPKGFLLHSDYLKAVNSEKNGNEKTTKHSDAPSGVDKTTNHDNEHVQSNNADATNNAKSDAQELKHANRADIKHSSEDSSYISTFLANQGIENKSNHDSFDVSRGIDDLVNSFNAKSEPEDEHVVSDSELTKLKNKWFIDASNLYSQRYSGDELANKINKYVLTRVKQITVE